MTRFARAKGSKSSNEKAPEDSTPWEIMKEQLLKSKKENDESKRRQEAEQQRIENYENFLKEHKTQKRKATWCDFPEMAANSKTQPVANGVQPAKNKKKKNNSENNEKTIVSNENTKSEENNEPSSNKKKKKKQKALNVTKETGTDHQAQDAKDSNTENGNAAKENGTTDKVPKKKNKKKKQKTAASEPQFTETENNDTLQVTEKQGKKKKNKNANNTDLSNESVNQSNDAEPKTNLSPKKIKNINKQNKIKALKKKKEKLENGQPVRRKEINDRSFQLILNGKEIELTRYDGFPIMKRDAERLEELKNSMIKKGIPKSEVQRTMKLERRRAEKALARMKRDVCYNCRKGGHNLSDCPDLKSRIPGVDAAEGVCFKCGSTEHRQFECKVQRDKEFRFATCFICKEPGHIARQCPDNPKGLYPNGGSCKLCGDVTHLRKDCPTVNDKKESTSIKLQTLDNADNLEGIGEERVVTMQGASHETSKKPKKITF